MHLSHEADCKIKPVSVCITSRFREAFYFCNSNKVFEQTESFIFQLFENLGCSPDECCGEVDGQL